MAIYGNGNIQQEPWKPARHIRPEPGELEDTKEHAHTLLFLDRQLIIELNSPRERGSSAVFLVAEHFTVCVCLGEIDQRKEKRGRD